MTDEKKIRVLVVEDDAQVRLVVAIHLRQLGYEVETASNGLQALIRLKGEVKIDGAGAGPETVKLPAVELFDADVILLDLLMPVMDGYEFLEKYDGPVPIIVMSGLGDIAQLPKQPFALVVKPMSMVDVVATLKEAAGSWRQQREGESES